MRSLRPRRAAQRADWAINGGPQGEGIGDAACAAEPDQRLEELRERCLALEDEIAQTMEKSRRLEEETQKLLFQLQEA